MISYNTTYWAHAVSYVGSSSCTPYVVKGMSSTNGIEIHELKGEILRRSTHQEASYHIMGLSSVDCKQQMGEEAGGIKVEDEIRTDVSSEAEKQKLGALRTLIESQHDPTSEKVDDLTMRRFLRARNQNIEKASHLLLKYQRWRKEFVPKGFISEAEITNVLAQRIFFQQGTDKEGHPIGVVFIAKYFPTKCASDEFKRCAVYFLDKLCSKMQRGQERFVVIADLQGWGYSNCDTRGYLGAISILQDCYPERLGKLLLVNVPYIFMAAWKMVYPFIDNNTRTKISFVDKGKLKSTLSEAIDESQIPENYGGKITLVAIEDS